jgi:hypothetical protein
MQKPLTKSAAVAAAVVVPLSWWAYATYMDQLNNALAVQRCGLEVEGLRKQGGGLPESVQCVDRWGARVAYYPRDDGYLLVSGGADHQEDLGYAELSLERLPLRSPCFRPNLDTVFLGKKPVQACLK